MADHEDADSDKPEPPDPAGMVIAAVLFEGGLAPLALVAGVFVGQGPLEDFAWSAQDAVLGVLAAVPMYVVFLAMMRRSSGPLARIRQILDETLRPLFGGRPTSDLALLAIAAGVGEEMLFRGVVQGALVRWLGASGGLASASLAFGLLHPITPTYIAIAGLLGAYLGGLWLVTGNLLTPIIAHAVYDFLALRTLLRTEPDPEPDPQ